MEARCPDGIDERIGEFWDWIAVLPAVGFAVFANNLVVIVFGVSSL